MAEGARRPVLLTRPAKLAKRRRTADEAGLSLTDQAQIADAFAPSLKIQRRHAGRCHGMPWKTLEGASAEKAKSSKKTKNAMQRAMKSAKGHPAQIEAATDWPMTGKEKAQPSGMVSRIDGVDCTFPLVFDISQSMTDHVRDQLMDYEEIEPSEQNGAYIAASEGQFDLGEIISKFCRRPQSVVRRVTSCGLPMDTCTVRSAVTEFSQMTVSHADPMPNGKAEKRPVYLLIIFASFDDNNNLQCDAYVTCVNRALGAGQQGFGVNWMVNRLIEKFIRQAAADKRSNGNRWFVACCMMEAVTSIPLIFNVGAFWRHESQAGITPPFEFLRHIANQLFSSGSAPSALAEAGHTALPLTDTVRPFDAQLDTHGVITDDLRQSPVPAIALPACWLIEEYNKLQRGAICAHSSSSTHSR